MAERQAPASPTATLAATVSSAKKALDHVRDAAERLASDDATEIAGSLTLLERARCVLDEGHESARAAIERSHGTVSGLHDAAVDSYGERLTAALRDAGLEPAGDANRPVVRGLVYVAWQNGKTGPSLTLNESRLPDFSLPDVVAAVKRHLVALEKQLSPTPEFMTALVVAYDAELSATGRTAGDEVSVQVLRERLLWARQSTSFRRDPRKGTFREYPLDVFRGDLYRALSADARAPDGRHLRTASGASSKDGVFMLVPELSRTGYVGRVWFEHGGAS